MAEEVVPEVATVADFAFGEADEENPAVTIEGYTVGAQYMMKASADFRPTVQGYKVAVGTRLHCVIQDIKAKADNPRLVETLEVELLGQVGSLYRHAAMPPAEALGGICLATTGLLAGVPKECLTRAAQPWALEDLERRRVNLTSLTEGVKLYSACIPQVKAQKEAAQAAKRRKLDLERREQDFASAGAGGGDREATGDSGGSTKPRASGGTRSGPGAPQGGKTVSLGPSPSQVSGRVEQGVNAFKDLLDRADEDRAGKGVMGHVVFALQLDGLSVEKGVAIPAVLYETE